MKYAVDCPYHGTVELSDAQYDAQMRQPNSFWKCPICGATSQWNDDVYEAYFQSKILRIVFNETDACN